MEYVDKMSVEVPDELLKDFDAHVGNDSKFVNRIEAIRTSVRKMLDVVNEINERHERLDVAGILHPDFARDARRAAINRFP